jgi:hypothetical protein
MLFLMFSFIFLSGGSIIAQPVAAGSSLKKTQDESQKDIQARKLSDAELDALLARLEKELGSIHSLKTEFIQERRLSIFTDPVEAKGVLLFVCPDNVRFEITEPFHSILIAGPSSVANFEFIGGEWKKLSLGSPDSILLVTRQIAEWLQGRFRDEHSLYEISALEGNDTVIVLTPKPEQLKKFITAIELMLTPEKSRIATVTIREPSEDYTHLKFFNQEKDVEGLDQFFTTTGSVPVQLPSNPDNEP